MIQFNPGDRVRHKKTNEFGTVVASNNVNEFERVYRPRSNKHDYVPVMWDSDNLAIWFIQIRKLVTVR